MNLYVQPDGKIIFVGDPPSELTWAGEAIKERASSVLPVGKVKRFCFLFLRRCFGEQGRIAAWTRQWNGPWTSRLYATGETFTHESRAVCLAWEHEQLERFYERIGAAE